MFTLILKINIFHRYVSCFAKVVICFQLFVENEEVSLSKGTLLCIFMAFCYILRHFAMTQVQGRSAVLNAISGIQKSTPALNLSSPDFVVSLGCC